MCAAGGALVASDARFDRVDRAVREAVIIGVPIFAGIYAARYPPYRRFGALLISAGFLWSLTALAESRLSMPYSIGRVAAWLIFPVVMYLILAFPDGRIAARRDRILYGGVLVLIFVLFIGSSLFVEAYPLHTPWATCSADCPANAFFVLDSEPAVMGSVVAPLREILAILLMAAVTGSLVRRLWSATRLRRHLIAPVVVMSAATTVTLAAYLITRRVDPDAPAVAMLGTLWSLCIPGLALGFLAGLVTRRLLVGDVLRRLSGVLGQRLDAGQLRVALATALEDPAVDVMLPAGGDASWRDSRGRVTPAPAPTGSGQSVSLVLDEDRAAVAALVHDSALSHDDELLGSVSSLVVAALKHESLTSRLEASLTQLEDSRHRISRAANAERARIERDLHDGAQQRLIVLRMKLSQAEDLARSDPAGAVRTLNALGNDIELALDELRSLAHGVYPSLLADRGIADAVRSAVLDSPLPVHLDVNGLTRHPAEVEAAVYFACLEAVQNAAKHAGGATGIWISLRQDDALGFEIRDDGPGFAPVESRSNGGLRNMRDRVETVGGRLIIDSTLGQGTSISGSVPIEARGPPPPDSQDASAAPTG